MSARAVSPRLGVRWRWKAGRRLTPRTGWKYVRNISADLAAIVHLRTRPGLVRAIRAGATHIETMGMSLPQLAQLHRAVRRATDEVLELGSGISTMVMAHALTAGHARRGRLLHFVEQDPGYADRVTAALAEVRLDHVVRRHVAEVVSAGRSDSAECWRYDRLPEGRFGVVLIDGPAMPVDAAGRPGAGADIRSIAEGLPTGAVVLVDNREATRRLILSEVPRLRYLGSSIRRPLHRYRVD